MQERNFIVSLVSISGFLILLFCLIGLVMPLEAAQFPPKILIKMPTRSRCTQFFSTLDQYYAKLSNQVPYHFVISCDIDDPIMNNPEVIARLNSYPNLSYYFSANSSKIEAYNKDIDKHLDFDIIILTSDDMIPLVQDFDLIIAHYMYAFFPEYDGVLHFNDGALGPILNTLPIVGRKFYGWFGYVYFPGYTAFFCDNELSDISKMLNKVVYFDQVLIEHRHPATGKGEPDLLYVRNNAYFYKDQELYLQRKALNFGFLPNQIINPLK
jgi:hypothetical protein